MAKKMFADLGFKMMVWTFKIGDIFNPPGDILDEFNISEGDIVVDYGCGPGRYLKKASELVGDNGRVYAVDILEIALEYAEKEIKQNNLKNVKTVLVENLGEAVADKSVDLIYALDMFHNISDPASFFKKLHRIIKADGILYIEDGHQPREQSINKIERSKMWDIIEQTERYLVCKARR